MDIVILTAIIQRVKAQHNVKYAWMVVHESESWHIKINEDPVAGPDHTRTIASGKRFSELPAYLSSLK